MSCRYGFRVLGPLHGRRRLVDHQVALSGYAACDSRAEVDREGHLSVFGFDSTFPEFLKAAGNTRGYDGPCCAEWHWFDIDRQGDVGGAAADTLRLVRLLCDRYQAEPDKLVLCFSGCKGFHVGIPTAVWAPSPSLVFHHIARRFAQQLATGAGLEIDASIYSKTGLLRAINSQHPRTGLHKRRLSLRQLDELSVEEVCRTAERPEPFDLPSVSQTSPQAVADWRDACQQVEQQVAAEVQSQQGSLESVTLTSLTRDFICHGAEEGERARRLFSAAANLAEFGCPPDLAHALLGESALDSGLTPAEVRRQIDCGLNHRSTEARRTGREDHDG